MLPFGLGIWYRSTPLQAVVTVQRGCRHVFPLALPPFLLLLSSGPTLPFPLFFDGPPLPLCTFRETDFAALDFNMADHLLY